MTSISIIIPYFNRENTIARCITSIRPGANTKIEIIIVDDCSSMPLQQFDNPLIKVVRLESNVGPIAARSVGAMSAKHDYLMFLDSDDELLPDWHEIFCAQIAAAPDCDVYGFPDEKHKNEEVFLIESLDQYWRWVQCPTRASDYLITIRMQAYRNVVMPKVRISEIWYIVQLFEFGLKAHYSNRPLFRYHQDSGNQLSRQRFVSLDTSRYTKDSLAYAVKVFNRNAPKMKQLAQDYHKAWFRRLLKEGLLSLSPVALARLFWGGHGQ